MTMDCATTAVKDVNKMITNKITLLMDDAWFQELLGKMLPFVNEGEILQLIDKTEVEICADCMEYETIDGEVIMDVFRCYDNQEYCLNCCGCEDHKEESWY